MRNYYCPGFVRGEKIYQKLLDLKNRCPEIFQENSNIKFIFDSFPGAIWNGGSYIPGSADIGYVCYLFDLYKHLDIPLQLTFTNPVLEQTDCYDRYCNQILSMGVDYNVEILISSPVLEQHIRTYYSNYKLNRSILMTEFDEKSNEFYENLLNKYERCVLPRRFSYDLEFLNSLSDTVKSHTEILCNETCPMNCPFIYSHYEAHGYKTLHLLGDCECKNLENKLFPNSMQYVITSNNLEQYENIGFSEFKLSGRLDEKAIVFSIVPYFIRQEYQLDVCHMLLLN